MNGANIINKENSYKDSPVTGKIWISNNESERKQLIMDRLNSKDEYKKFTPVKAQTNGHVILTTDLILDAATRGQLLLEIEEYLKAQIDEGITLWLEPVGDKSKLRSLRGIQIKY
tara:strand:+ start:16894 stop:17238 length:345 start_codon:yes stop_codon:yes gene_type:complete